MILILFANNKISSSFLLFLFISNYFWKLVSMIYASLFKGYESSSKIASNSFYHQYWEKFNLNDKLGSMFLILLKSPEIMFLKKLYMVLLEPFFPYLMDLITIKNSLKSITPLPSRSTVFTSSLICSEEFTSPRAKKGSSKSYTVI